MFSGSYLARTDLDWLNFLLYAVKSNSNVSSVGAQNIVGPGTIVGARAVATLPMRENYFHTLSFGWDYKRFDQEITSETLGTLVDPDHLLSGDRAVFRHADHGRRGHGLQRRLDGGRSRPGRRSEPVQSQARAAPTASFIYLRGDDDPHARSAGEVAILHQDPGPARRPGSGQQRTIHRRPARIYVRGYLEIRSAGRQRHRRHRRTPHARHREPDRSAQGRKGSAGKSRGQRVALLRSSRISPRRGSLHALPNQPRTFWLGSYGVGTRIKFLDYMNGMVAFAMPTTDQQFTQANDPHVLFRVWGEF